jgi:uroporphyrinogen-III synthase
MNQAALTGRNIVITRPLGQANRLSSLIQEAGGNVHLFALLEIVPLTDYQKFDEKITQLNQVDWAIFISSNAVQNSLPRVIEKLGTVPGKLKFAAIGPKTAADLAEFGIQNTLTPQDRFDSEALLALPEMQQVKNQKVLIFRGIGGREVLAETLKQRGAIVEFAESYQRINPQKDLNTLEELTKQHKLDAIVVTSSEAMRYLLDMGKDATWLKNIKLCVNHARIAEEADALGFRAFVAETSGDEAMLNCLANALKC